ncbi:hypothetical protein A0H81_10866 [Grifola frondosa]|uniref:Uncharacterized protein n=1 Tax=Grifola frondosa TaxID=5627 RepID=A0A1C7LXA6_GRIFR|nr:hypothetical protein A0H81_10866 [Grifola frondosa]
MTPHRGSGTTPAPNARLRTFPDVCAPACGGGAHADSGQAVGGEVCRGDGRQPGDDETRIPPHPHPNAAYVVRLPLPSSPALSAVPFLTNRCPDRHPRTIAAGALSSRSSGGISAYVRLESTPGFHPGSLPPPSSFPSSFFPSSASPQSAYTCMRSTSVMFLPSSPASSSCSSSSTAPTSHGYMESSVLALSMLMSLPEAYLMLQAEKWRSFFVYQSDLSLLWRIKARAGKGSRSKQRQDNIQKASRSMESCGGGKDADEIGFSILVRQLHINNMEAHIYTFGRADAQLRRNWSTNQGSFVMVSEQNCWTHVHRPYQRERPLGWWSQLALSLLHFPSDCVHTLNYPMSNVNLYITRLNITFDRFHTSAHAQDLLPITSPLAQNLPGPITMLQMSIAHQREATFQALTEPPPLSPSLADMTSGQNESDDSASTCSDFWDDQTVVDGSPEEQRRSTSCRC